MECGGPYISLVDNFPPFLSLYCFILHNIPMNGKPVMNCSYGSLHTPPPPLRFVLESIRRTQT